MKSQTKYQTRARAYQLIAQLPEDDIDAACEIVREFIEMVKKEGLLRPRHSPPVLVSLGGSGTGNSPRRRARATDKPDTDPE